MLAGSIEVQRGGDGQWLPVARSSSVWPGDAIRTGTDGQASLSFADKSEVVLQAATTVMLDRFFLRTQDRSVVERLGRVVLFDGSVAFDIQPFPAGPSPWEFVTGSEIILITGTSGIMSLSETDLWPSIPAVIKQLLEAGDMKGAMAAAEAADAEVPTRVQMAMDHALNLFDATLSEKRQVSEKMQARLRSMPQSERNSNEGIALANSAEETLKDIDAMLERMRELAKQSLRGADVSFALVEGSAVLTEIVTDTKDSGPSIRVSEIPEGVSLIKPTLKPPKNIDAIIATLASDIQIPPAVASITDTAIADGVESNQLQAVLVRDSNGDEAPDEFVIHVKNADGADSKIEIKSGIDRKIFVGTDEQPPTAWGVLGAETVATLAVGGPLQVANKVIGSTPPQEAGSLLEQVKLANMVRMVISDPDARKQLVASGNMTTALQTALVNISQDKAAQATLSLMARAGSFHSKGPRGDATGPASNDGESDASRSTGTQVVFSVPNLTIADPPPAAVTQPDPPKPGEPKSFAVVGPTNTKDQTTSASQGTVSEDVVTKLRRLRTVKAKTPLRVDAQTAEQVAQQQFDQAMETASLARLKVQAALSIQTATLLLADLTQQLLASPASDQAALTRQALAQATLLEQEAERMTALVATLLSARDRLNQARQTLDQAQPGAADRAIQAMEKATTFGDLGAWDAQAARDQVQQTRTLVKARQAKETTPRTKEATPQEVRQAQQQVQKTAQRLTQVLEQHKQAVRQLEQSEQQTQQANQQQTTQAMERVKTAAQQLQQVQEQLQQATQELEQALRTQERVQPGIINPARKQLRDAQTQVKTGAQKLQQAPQQEREAPQERQEREAPQERQEREAPQERQEREAPRERPERETPQQARERSSSPGSQR